MIQACTITVYGKAFFSMIFRKTQPKNEIFWVLIYEQESILTKEGFKQEWQSNSGEKKVLYLIFSKKPYVLSINHGFLNELWTLNGTSLYRDFFENLKYNTIVQSILKIVLYCVVPIRALIHMSVRAHLPITKKKEFQFFLKKLFFDCFSSVFTFGPENLSKKSKTWNFISVLLIETNFFFWKTEFLGGSQGFFIFDIRSWALFKKIFKF